MSGSGINKVILIGHLGQNPDLRYTPEGSAIVKVNLATTELVINKKSGQKEPKTEWHHLVLFGQIAETAGNYLQKGSHIYIEGKLHTRKWQDKYKQDRSTTEILVDSQWGRLFMLDRGNAIASS
ncbi:MAG: single-stranded DNA-binding protein [Enterobacterales bacterium]|nr:single-stranded DNA-binding protein [Enterobacterales bacterium]